LTVAAVGVGVTLGAASIAAADEAMAPDSGGGASVDTWEWNRQPEASTSTYEWN
jgi:hypothetical protein